MRKPQSGTWTNWKVVNADDVIRVPKKRNGSKVTDVFGATMMVRDLCFSAFSEIDSQQVNMHTALGLLTDIDPVQSGHYILQNGANSGVSEFIS